MDCDSPEAILEAIKIKVKSMGNQRNLLSQARKRATSICSSFDKTIKRNEIKNLLEIIEKKYNDDNNSSEDGQFCETGEKSPTFLSDDDNNADETGEKSPTFLSDDDSEIGEKSPTFLSNDDKNADENRTDDDLSLSAESLNLESSTSDLIPQTINSAEIEESIVESTENVDGKGNDDDPSLSTGSPRSSTSNSIPQTVNSDKNEESIVDSTQNIEAAIIDQTFETLAKESLVGNGEWIIGSGKVNVRESLKKWKSKKERLIMSNLGYYDIIDLTPGTNSDFIKSLSKSEYEEIKSFDLPELPNVNNDEIKELIVKIVKASDFRKAVNESFFSTRDDESKEFVWDFAYHLANSFDHGNDLLHPNMSERMYREIFLTPIIRSLFRKKNTDLDLFFGEVCLYASAEDADLKKDDAEDRNPGRKIDAVWATKPPKIEFAICEVSGPPNQRQHSHFFTDKIKIGKMLKIMLNRIVRVYGGNSSIFSLLKVYGLQVYDHNVIVYEMTVPFRELYVFREVIRSQLPTSRVNIAQMRQCEMILKSLNDLHEYVMESGLCTPPDKIKASLFVTEMTYTPGG
ncbi:4054_t:CDS:10, partial [Dentiscutata erythropus]